MTDAPVARSKLSWGELHWSQPVTAERATGVLRAWAADQRSPLIALEARGSAGTMRYLLGTSKPARAAVLGALTGLVPDVRVTDLDAPRQSAKTAGRLSASTRHRPLRQDGPSLIVRAVLAALARAGHDEELVLQLVFGPRRVPLPIIAHSPSALTMPWYQAAWIGNGGQLDSEKRAALRAKVGDHGYACTIRIGVRGATAQRRRSLVLGLMAALRTSEAAGMTLRLQRERSEHVDGGTAPNWRWPLRLNVAELAGLTAWPIDADDLPGQPPAHPRLLPPGPQASTHGRLVAAATAPGVHTDLRLDLQGAQHHLHVAGLTGTGKSNLLLSLILQDIDAGRAVVVVEPKGDLVDDVLARIPDHRKNDVVVLDAADPAPVGLNPLQARGRSPEVLADSVLATFKQLYDDNLGPRSTDILHASLLTLARHPKPSLVMLGPLLTNATFRRRLTAQISDPVFLGPFWASYERWSPAEQAAAIAAPMNKLRPLLRPSLRAVLGQSEPRFAMQQVFTERKILLVPLRRGVIGPDAAALLGSLVVGELWLTIQARTGIPQAKRHPVTVVIDEVQDYLRLPTDLGEALAQARGLGVGFTLAHQFLGQLPTEMRAAVLSNARSRVVFQTSAADATEFAKGHPELRAEDFTSLGRFEAYASLFSAGHSTPYASGRTYPPGKPLRAAAELKARSRARYGVSRGDIEAGFAKITNAASEGESATGRRRRTDP